MNSMTGFGRASSQNSAGKLTIEIKTVNNRYLDFNVRMPRFMLFLEDDTKNYIKSRIARGRVEVFVNYFSEGSEQKTVSADIGLAKAYLEAGKAISSATGLSEELTLAQLMKLPDVLVFTDENRDEEALKELLVSTLAPACDMLCAVRNAEGIRLGADIKERLATVSNIRDEIEKSAGNVEQNLREKLGKKLEENLASTEIDINRFNQEILYLTDKSSITEELVRLSSHLITAKSSVSSGRNMDFLLQEFTREFNTIGSKSADIGITNCVLAAKSELEKIREQVQNIE